MSEHIIEVPNPSPKWPEPIWCGFLKKYTITLGNVKWRKRFFVLTLDGNFFYFKNQKSTTPRKPPVPVKGSGFCRSNLKCNCVEILRQEKPFFVFTEEAGVIDKLEDCLEIAGCNRLPPKIVEEIIPEIVQKEASSWNTGLVLDWLSTQYLDKDTSFLIYKDQMKVSGKGLLLMNENSLRRNGIVDFDHLEVILESIDALKKNKGRFDYGSFVVFQKILLGVIRKKEGSLASIEALRTISNDLCNVKSLEKGYLDYNELDATDVSIQAFKFNDPDAPIPLDGTFLFHNDESPPLFPDSLKFETINSLQIVISDRIDWSEFEKSYTVLSSNMISFPKIEPGKLMMGVVVGPWLLFWTKTGIVIPKRMNSVLLKMTALYEKVGIKDIPFGKAKRILSELVCNWNVTKRYHPKLSNCFHFCEDLLSRFGVKKKKLYDLIKPLVENGEMGYTFNPSNNFISHFSLNKGTEYSFKTHTEFDEFIVNLSKKDEMGFPVDYPDSYSLLKAIDISFWLSHFEDPKSEKFSPMLDEESKLEKGKLYQWWKSSGCLFEDPRKLMEEMFFFDNERD